MKKGKKERKEKQEIKVVVRLVGLPVLYMLATTAFPNTETTLFATVVWRGIQRFEMALRKVNVSIPVEDRHLDGVINVPCSSSWSGTAVVLTHGAGGDMNFHHLEKIASHLAKAGILCLRFTCRTPNFKYRVRCFENVLIYLKEHDEFNVQKCIIAGRSMGARVAAELATTSDLTKEFTFGVVCLSYPLHPQRKTHELRMSSIIHLGVPVLFISGTKDSFCRRDLMERVLAKIGVDWTMHWVENADHSLNINNKPNEEVIDMMCEWVVKWSQSVFMAER